jgi:hypothetical protein
VPIQLDRWAILKLKTQGYFITQNTRLFTAMLLLSITNLTFIESTAKNSRLQRRLDSSDTETKTVGSAKPDQDKQDIYQVPTEGNWEWDNVPYGILDILSGPVLAFFGYQY